MRPFTMVFGLLDMASQSATDLMTLVLKSSTRHQRWSVPLPGF